MEATTKQFNLFADGKGDGFGTCIVCGRTLKANDRNVEIGIDGFEFGTIDKIKSQGEFGIESSCNDTRVGLNLTFRCWGSDFDFCERQVLIKDAEGNTIWTAVSNLSAKWLNEFQSKVAN
jgi:hypothetical protein